MPKKITSAKKFKPKTHTFVFKTEEGRELKFKTKVRDAKKPVKLELSDQHVLRSIELGGSGNTQTCSMAVCGKEQAHAFAHPVEGYIDWTYTRAYVVSKLKKDGSPAECYVYAHHDNIAKVNDGPGGQVKLLRELQRNGNRTIELTPIPERDPDAPRPDRKPGVKDGSRRRVSSFAKGAKARFAYANMGGVA